MFSAMFQLFLLLLVSQIGSANFYANMNHL